MLLGASNAFRHRNLRGGLASVKPDNFNVDISRKFRDFAFFSQNEGGLRMGFSTFAPRLPVVSSDAWYTCTK